MSETGRPRLDPEVLRDMEREAERKKVWRERFLIEGKNDAS